MNLPSTSLFFKEGTSDKFYKAAIEASGDGFVVNFAYGRTGGTPSVGSKTSSPVSIEAATKIYNALVLSKTAKGYKVDGAAPAGIGSVVAVAASNEQRDTGLRPQLLNPITEEEAEAYITDDDFCAQEKFDGKRLTFRKNGSVIAANKKGLSVGFPDAIAKDLNKLQGTVEIDGEAIGDTLFAFDLLEHCGRDLRASPYAQRNDCVQAVAGVAEKIIAAPTAIGTDAKRAMMKHLKAEGKEGIVFKRLSAPWSAGRPASGGNAVKCKFWASCSAVVAKVNAKRSIQVSLDGQPVGNVTISPNWEVPKVGQVVEIRYLYVAAKGGSLYQPNYLGPRDDVSISECTFEQQKLKYKDVASSEESED